jgi:hypothetical protein
MLNSRLEALDRYALRGPEPRREATDQIFGARNSLKALTGQFQGLHNESILAKKRKEEAEFRALVAKNPELQNKFGDAWEKILQADKLEQSRINELRFRTLGYARLARIALTIVQYADQVKKPDGERLDGYHDAQLPSLRFRLFSPAPIFPQLDAALLTQTLYQSMQKLGNDDPFIKAALNGRTPAEAAGNAMSRTKLGDLEYRKALLNGGESAVQASSDPAIELARKVNPSITDIQEWYENNVESVLSAEAEKLGLARFAVYGKSVYPDANFTLRLAFGKVKGYPMNGTVAPPITTFYGLYDRAYSFGLRPPFNLTERWLKAKDQIDLSVPFNFASTCDIIGGNSGSPVVNRQGELVGLIFDGNIESLIGNFVYDEGQNRAIAVHSSAMTHALRKVYGAASLMDEIEGGK